MLLHSGLSRPGQKGSRELFQAWLQISCRVIHSFSFRVHSALHRNDCPSDIMWPFSKYATKFYLRVEFSPGGSGLVFQGQLQPPCLAFVTYNASHLYEVDSRTARSVVRRHMLKRPKALSWAVVQKEGRKKKDHQPVTPGARSTIVKQTKKSK